MESTIVSARLTARQISSGDVDRMPASASRRRLLLGTVLAPMAAAWPRHAAALAQPVAAVPTVLGVDLAARAEVSATGICIFDAAGRLRVVFGSFDHSP